MCGRFTLRTPAKDIAEVFGLAGELPLLKPRYNIAPTQPVATIRIRDGQRQLSFLHWGLVPFWADNPSIGNRLINARADSVATKPSFRSAFKKHRCLVVADGFYEWKETGKKKQPYFIWLKDGRPFAFAGLAEHWHRGDETLDSCVIITTEPNALLADLHDRMPAILSPHDYDLWLEPDFQGKDELLTLLRPYPAEEMTAFPVSTVVNNPRNEKAACIEPYLG